MTIPDVAWGEKKNTKP